MNWQPIETHPIKDHEFFIVAIPLISLGYENTVLELHVETWEGQMYPVHLEGCIDSSDCVLGATHWMPLPTPPE